MEEKGKRTQTTRPPIIAVLGHVDHGKTTLLDTIRKTNVAAKEHGGITQHIGAYQITTPDKKLITFVDTPGHEAFMKMRSRGAKVADIALLVVAADDGVMPQTKESIKIIEESKTPMIVVVNKIDLPTANVEKIKKDLGRNGVQVEGFGGNIPIALVSAKDGTGIPLLFSLIFKEYEKIEKPDNKDSKNSIIIVETKLDKGKGMVGTGIVKEGVLHAGQVLYDVKGQIAKVRALFDEYGSGIKEAPTGKPVEIVGFTRYPEVGELLFDSPQQPIAPQMSKQPESVNQVLPDFLSKVSDEKKLKVILKADTAGSLEAILLSLDKKIDVVSKDVGDITEADILLAKSTGAFVIGFCVKCRGEVEKLAQTEFVVFRNYSIIYELLTELQEVVNGMQEVLYKERELGVGEIIAEFPYEGLRVAGVKVKSGRIAKGDKVKILRDTTEVARARVKSVRKGKLDTTKVEAGTECGVLFDVKVDFVLGDAIIAFI